MHGSAAIVAPECRTRASGSAFLLTARRRRGFGLLETIVSLGILMVCMTILAQLVLQGMDQSQIARQRAHATLLAQERLEELLAHRDDLGAWKKSVTGKFPLDKTAGVYEFIRKDVPDFRWSWRVGPVKDVPRMKLVTVRVMWTMPRRKALALACELSTLVDESAAAGLGAGEGATP